MIERASDHAERLAALDPSASFIVQAPAGSGKTELLIQRFLTLLATVEHPESIVAVTFTRKAAGEMRHRIIDALQKAASEAAPDEEHRRQTWELCQRVHARDEELGWQLVQHPSRLRIQTIDSLCGMLVRQMPWMSRMGAVAAPEENSDYLYREAARLVMDQTESPESNEAYAASVDRLLRHLDNNLDTVENLLTGMLRSRDAWLRHVFSNEPSAELRSALQAAMRQIIADDLQIVRSLVPPQIVSETMTLADFAARNIAVENPLSDLAHCAGLEGLPGASHEYLTQWRGLAELFLTKDGGRRKALTVKNGFPAKPECRAEKNLCLSLELPPELMRALHGVRSLPPEGFSETQWEVLSALMQLLLLAVAQLKIVFQREGKVDFTEIAHAARTSLGPSDNPTDLAFSLDCRIQHLLVDEFQDTAQGQYELLKALTAEWSPGDGRTLFLVGDPMQSIYGFRDADVALFLGAQRQKAIGNVRLTPLNLRVNFRSNAGIVTWVNDALGNAFPTRADSFRGAVTYEPSIASDIGAAAQAIHIHPLLDMKLDRTMGTEAKEVVKIILESRQQNPAGRIAVLVRARTHLPAIVNALRANDIKFQAVEIDSLAARSVVQDLLAVTGALLHPADRTSWLSILRAPWCGLTLADLQSLVGNDYTSTLWELLNDEARLNSISANGRARIERVKPVLAAAIAEHGRLPLRRWVEATWMALGGPACLENETGLEDAAVYLDLLESSSAGADLRDSQRFYRDVAGLFARPDAEADEKLQLLTIHKAKGLEFDTVIIPGLGRRPRGDDRRLLLWLEYINSRGVSQLLLAPIKETGTKSDPTYTYVQKIQNAKLENESLRMLYVAATRAKSHLHLLGHTGLDPETKMVKEPESRSLLSKFWTAAAAEFEKAAAELKEIPGVPAAAVEIADAPIGTSLRRLSMTWEFVAPPPDIHWQPMGANTASGEDSNVGEHVSFEWATELQRRVGIVVHAMLQRADETFDVETSRPTISAALVAQGLSGDRLREAIGRVEKALRATLTDARGRWILRQHQEDQREYSLCGLIAGRVRRVTLDRTFVDEDGLRWIIDYKTGSHEGGNLEAFLNNEHERYRPQLENYARLMALLDPRPLRLGLYFPMLQAWREWT